MAPDLIKPNDILYYMGNNGEWNAIGGMLHCDLKNNEATYGDIDSSVLEPTGEKTFSFKMKKKQWYSLQKSLGLIKAKYKRKRKGKRYVWYEVINYMI